MTKSDNKKLLVLLLQGWGLSSSWEKNAIASASPGNFNILWQKYNHQILRPILKEASMDKKLFYKAFYNDKVKTNSLLIDEALSDKKILENNELHNLFNHVSKHSSKLHFVITLSEDNFYSNRDHLVTLAKLAKLNSIFNQCIHIFFSDFPRKETLVDRLEKMESALSQAGNVDISTVNPLANLWSKEGLIKTLRLLVSGNGGRRILTPKQLSTLSQNSTLLRESFILSKGQNFNIGDFDGVLFVDHDPEPVFPLVNYLSQANSYSTGSKPKYLYISSLIADAWKANNNSIVSASGDSTWLSKLETLGKKGLILSDDQTLNLITSIVKLPSTVRLISMDKVAGGQSSIADKLENIQRFISSRLSSKDEDFILVDFPYIAEACQEGVFGKITDTIRKTDSFLQGLESCIIENDGILFLSSLFGVAEEQTLISLPYGNKSKYSINPLPFIKISASTKNPVPSSLSMLDLISIKNDLNYLKKSILEVLE